MRTHSFIVIVLLSAPILAACGAPAPSAEPIESAQPAQTQIDTSSGQFVRYSQGGETSWGILEGETIRQPVSFTHLTLPTILLV